MKNLDESFDKKFLDAGVGPKYYLSKSPAEVKSFIRQREKDLLDEVFSRLPSKYDPMTREEMLETIEKLQKELSDE